MKKGWKQKVIAYFMILAMIGTLFPQNSGFWGTGNGERTVEAEETTQLTDEQIDSLYQKVSYQRGSVHDPSIIKNGSDYYVFGSHMGVAKTTDLKNWTAPEINAENVDNAYYGVRDENGTVTKVSYEKAFQTAAYGTKEVKIADDGTTVSVDFSAMPAAAWNTAVTTNPDEVTGQTSAWTIKGNMWAPDIIYNTTMKKYCMYLSLNGNAWNSVVILLTADAIEGPYVYEAPIIYSGFTSSEVTSYTKTDLSLVLNNGTDLDSLPSRYSNLITGVSEDGTSTSKNHGSYGTYWPHAIDPAVFYDSDGKLWMTYGSWSGGIYMIELDETTGLRDYTVSYPYQVSGKDADESAKNANVTSDPYFGTKIAGGYYVSGEGSYIEKIGNYYYLFMSYGFYSPTGGYNMRIFRSEKPNGPYVDVNGTNAIYTSGGNNFKSDSRGLQLMGNYQWDTMEVAEVAQGHNSALQDEDGNAYVFYHTKLADGTAGHELRIHQLYTNEDGWIVAAPYEYAGEKVNDAVIKTTAIPAEKIVGAYDLIVHQYSNPKASDEGTVEANMDIVKPVDIVLNADGSITGSYTGTWVEKEGTAYATITIDSVEYKGVFAEQTISGTNVKTMCFTAVNTKGVCIWGSKALGDDVIVAYNAKNEKAVVPSSTIVDLTLDTAGEYGAEIAWSSSNTAVISNDGKVSRQTADQTVVLTKTITKGNYAYQQNYSITVYGTEGDDTDKLMSYNSLQAGDTLMAVPSVNANTGVSLTFDIKSFNDDWTKMFTTKNNENVFLSILNYGGENIFPHSSATLSEEAKNSGYAAWQLFLYQDCTVKISYNVDGSISFYKDGILMLTYGADVAIGKNTVASLSKAIALAVRQGGLNVKYGMKNLHVGYALDYDGSTIDTSGYLYYQDYEEVSDASKVWISTNAQSYLTIDSDSDHGNYLSYSFETYLNPEKKDNSRGAYSQFSYTDAEGNSVDKVDGNYTVELDTYLKAGNKQETQFAITGTDYAYSGNNINYGLTGGYILLLSTTNSTTWTVNGDSSQTVTIPNDSWVHIKASVSTENKRAVVTISDGSSKLYNGVVTINGTGSLYGLYNLAGRYYPETYIDNVKVYETPEENTGTITSNTEGKLYLDTASDVTVKFSTDGKLSENDTISINGKNVKAGEQCGLITVNSITYEEKKIAVNMTAAPMSGWNSVQGTYEVALLDSYFNEVKTETLQYDLDSLSENSAYAKIATVAYNEYTSAYYKVVGTKMYFMTIVKSNKIHCDQVTAGDVTYGWSNGIASELYMNIGEKKYSVGSHVYKAESANPVGWGEGTEKGSFDNDLILDTSSVVRGYMAFGTFDNDDDIDKGCVLLNVVDLTDIGYTVSNMPWTKFTLSGYLGPNDASTNGSGVAFVEVDGSKTYTIPGYSAEVSGKAYPDTESEVTVTFKSTGTMSSDDTVKINDTSVKIGDTVGLATVKNISFGNGTAEVILKTAPMQERHSLIGTYDVALYNSLSNELASANVEYELSMSETTEYEQVATVADNAYTSAYYKVVGTKMYFMTIVKSNKIHCDGITAGEKAYGWWNGIASQIYMTIDGTKYSVGSHVYLGLYSNAITWDSDSNNLIVDGSSVVRSYMAFGTFNNDEDEDRGCILLNVVDLADIGYNISNILGKNFTLSGYLGPNDYDTNGSGVAFVEVDGSKTYTIPGYSAEISGTAYLDQNSEITVTFTSTKSMSSNNAITINGTAVTEGSRKDMVTVKSITYEEKTVTVVLNMAAISGQNEIPGSYKVALTTGESDELASADVKYSLELSENTAYKKITTDNNEYSSAYVKVDGTKMYFMTVIKSDKIHCDGVTAGDITYAWWNGIASELYMTVEEKKYSVGSHVYNGKSANPIGWGTGTENGSFDNDLILDSSSVVRGFMALGTFDDDTDPDIGCVLLNVIDMADISYTQEKMEKLVFSLSGLLGPNDGDTNGSGIAFVAVSDKVYYVFSENDIHVCTRVYTEPTCVTDGYYTYTDQQGFEYKETKKNSATGHSFEMTYADNVITVSCSKGDSTKTAVLNTNTGNIGDDYSPAGDTANVVVLPTQGAITKEGYSLQGWAVSSSGDVEYQDKVEISELFSSDESVNLYAVWKDIAPPTGTITIAESTWDSFLETITFGLYQSKQETITITAEDNVGIGKISYLISTGGTTYAKEALEALSEESWKEYDDSAEPMLQKDTQNVVYAKITDTTGNVTYISSDGIIEDETAPEITDFSITTGSLTDSSVSFQITSNEKGLYYIVVNKDADDALKGKSDSDLASAVISAAEKGTEIEAGKEIAVPKTGLVCGTSYNAYLVVKDTAGNVSSCSTTSFTTAQEMIAITNANIDGDAVYGSSLTASGENNKNAAMKYQWYRSSAAVTDSTELSSLTAIDGAVAASYEIKKEDVGNYLAAVITIDSKSYRGSARVSIAEAVQPKTITVSAKASDKVYDKTTAAQISELSLDGVIDGDTVTASAGSAVFADADAAEGKEVTVSGITLSGADASAYQLEKTTVTTKADINKKEIKAGTVVIEDKVYDGTTDATVSTITFLGVIAGDEISYHAVAAFADSNAGSGKGVTGTVTLTETSAKNYCLASEAITGTASISKKLPSYTVPTGLTAVYGTTLGAIELPKGFTFEQPETTSVGMVGENSFTVKYTPQDTVNYQCVENIPVTITVKKAPAVYEVPTGLTAVYGQTLETVALPAGFTFQDALSTEVGTVGVHTFLVDYTPDDPKTEETKTGIEVTITVEKAVPSYVVPEALAARYGQTLGDLETLLNGTGWSFVQSGTTSVGEVGEKQFEAVYTPQDTQNYEIVTGQKLTVLVIPAVPTYTTPKDLTAVYGMTLKEVVLPEGFSFDVAKLSEGLDTKVGTVGEQTFKAIYTPKDTNYSEVKDIEIKITVSKSKNTPNMPDASETWNVVNSVEHVSDVKLPENWVWSEKDAGLALTVGTDVTATALYNGADKGNYETESVQVTIRRSVCEHTATELRNEKAADCTTKGYTGDTYCTICEELVTAGSKVPALGHSFTKYVSDGNATCTKDGTMTAKCDRCDETNTVTEEGSKTAHKEVIDPAVEATCTTEGKTEGTHCGVCGEILKAQESVLALGHDYTSEVTKEPTTEEEGIRTYTCSRCDSSYTEAISKLPSPEHKHLYTESITKAATCTQGGIKTYTCSCGDSYTEKIEALGHTFGEYVSDNNASCLGDGTKTAVCERCGEKKTVADNGSKTGHKEVTDPVVAATCTTEGKTEGKHCFVCAEVIIAQETVPALGHKEVIDPAVEATCTTGGKTAGAHCEVCGEILKAQESVSALGHDYTSEVTKEPTTEETGIRTYTCSRCDSSYTEDIPKLPEPEHQHTYTESITKAATCTGGGIKTYLCSCDDSYTEPIEALGHAFGEYVSDNNASCLADGTKTAVCERCGEKKTVADNGSKTGHKEVTDPAVAATCTTEGKTEGKHCFVCAEVIIAQETVPALGHNYTSAITKQATSTETGIRTYTCSRCGSSYTEVIPKLPETNTGSTGNSQNSGGSTITVPEDTDTNEPSSDNTSESSGQTTSEIKPDGTKVETVTETAEDGTVKETVKETMTDGSVKESVKETQTDGAVKESIKETLADGTVKEQVTETKSDGMVTSVATETKADGSVAEVREVKAKDDSVLTITVETDAEGKTNANSVIRTGNTGETGTVEIAAGLMEDVAASSKVSSVIVEITDTTINSSVSDSKKTTVNVSIPSVEGVEVEKVILTKESIATAQETGKKLTVNVITQDTVSQSSYTVTIPVSQLAKISSKVEEINVTVNAENVVNVADNSKKDAITKVVDKNNGKKKKTCVVSVAENEKLDAGMKVKIPVTNKTTIAEGSNVYVYKYNAKTGKLIETANCKQKVAADGSVVIEAKGGSDYVVSAKKLSGNKVETTKDNISVSVSKNEVKAGKKVKLSVSLPETVSLKNEFGTEKAVITYKSDDSKVASVSASGNITTKKKGTAVITTTIKLASGQKVVEKQKITVK